MRRTLLARSTAILGILSLAFGTVQSLLAPPIATAAPPVQTVATPTNLFRVRITLASAHARQRLDGFGVTVLQERAGSAIVLADADQLETLARLRYQPEAAEDLGPLVLAQSGGAAASAAAALLPLVQLAGQVDQQKRRTRDAGELAAATATLRQAAQALTPDLRAAVVAFASLDDDGDGLTNTQEQWWCTSATNPDSDGDGATDGDEVAALKDWLGNRRGGPPSTGKPFATALRKYVEQSGGSQYV